MKKSFIKFFDKIIVILLGIAGIFTSCKPPTDSNCEPISGGGIGLMYGPYATFYLVKGVVMNDSNSKPIPNIRIIKQISDNYNDTLYSNSKGEYGFSDYYMLNNVVHLEFEDIDGEENYGHFKTKKLNTKITNEDKEKIDECYLNNGRYVKIQNVKLQKKN